MKPILIFLHIAVCMALILIVLLQRGKGAGMGAAFGGSSQTVFGSAGATTFLHKVTTIAAIVFMLTSLGLSIFFSRATSSSIMEGVTPAPPPAPPITTTEGAQATAPAEAPAAETTEAPAPSGDASEDF